MNKCCNTKYMTDSSKKIMKIVDVKNAPKMKNPFKLDTAKIYDTEHAVAVHMTLKPGESLKPHITPVDVFFYVLEGESDY